MNRCVAGDDTEYQSKCKFYEKVRGQGKQCWKQRFYKFCTCLDAPKEPFDDKDSIY
jgi:hypothetical protein